MKAPRHWELEPIPKPRDPPLKAFTTQERRDMQAEAQRQFDEALRMQDQQQRALAFELCKADAKARLRDMTRPEPIHTDQGRDRERGRDR